MRRHKTYLFLLLLLVVGRGYAQTGACSQDNLLNIHGSWNKHEDVLSPGKNYKPEMKPEIFKRIDRIQQVFQSAYPKPAGAEASWYRNIFGSPLYKSGSVTYSLAALVTAYYCNPTTHKPALEDETGNWIRVFVNHFDRFISFDTSMKVGHLYAAFMYPRVGKLKNNDLFQLSKVRANERFIIVSRAGELPYTPLTRKEYLLALKGKLEREKLWQISRALPFRKEEAAKQQTIEYYNREYDPTINAIAAYLTSATEEDLSRTAFVKNNYDTRFTDEKDGGRMIVVLNVDYFKNTAHPYDPAFMLVYWSWNDGEGPSGGLLRPVAPDMNVCCKVAKVYRDSIEQNLDINALQRMLNNN